MRKDIAVLCTRAWYVLNSVLAAATGLLLPPVCFALAIKIRMVTV